MKMFVVAAGVFAVLSLEPPLRGRTNMLPLLGFRSCAISATMTNKIMLTQASFMMDHNVCLDFLAFVDSVFMAISPTSDFGGLATDCTTFSASSKISWKE